MTRILLGLGLLFASPAMASTPEERAQEAELDRVRLQVADEVHLVAFDLIDELVYGWVEEPVFAKPTSVVLAGVTVPVGLGSGMQALMENHIASVLIANPSTNVQLAHCPACTQVVVHSGPEATVVSRGIDNPDVLAELGATTGQYALFVDVEAEGSFLVLRARLTKLTPDLPIVWSHTIATSSSTPAMLRESSNLKSAEDARKEYLDVLHDRGPILIPVRFGIRTYAVNENQRGGVPPPPFLWLQSGVEVGVTDAHAWTASFLVGASYIPQAYQGLMAQARVNRLLTGRARSHTRPDLYGFVGGSVMTVWGVGTASFTNDRLNEEQLRAAIALENGEEPNAPRATFGTFQVGAELRVGNRVGVAGFYETLPGFANASTMGDYIRPLGLVGFQCVGTEVTFWF